MKIAVLSTNKNLYSTRRLVEAGEARGHEVPVINHKRCYMNIVSSKPSVHYNGQAIEGVDAIIPRIGASISFYGAAVVRQFEVMGVYSVNESVAITRSRDKLRALQLLSRKGIGLPVTGFASSPGDTDDLLDLVGGAPVVIKLLEGTQGVGVVPCVAGGTEVRPFFARHTRWPPRMARATGPSVGFITSHILKSRSFSPISWSMMAQSWAAVEVIDVEHLRMYRAGRHPVNEDGVVGANLQAEVSVEAPLVRVLDLSAQQL